MINYIFEEVINNYRFFIMKKTILILIFILVIVAIIPIFLPKTMHVEREYIYNNPIEEVFQNFNELKIFTSFNEWTSKDDDIILNFSKQTKGLNAKYSWKSKDKTVGDGHIKIIEVADNEFINYELQFGESKGNTAEIIFQKIDENKTKVIWSFDSEEAKYPFQIFNLLMKKPVKDNLNKSLINLENILNKNKGNTQDNSNIKITENNNQKIFGILQQTSIDSDEISTAIDESLGTVYSYLKDVIGKTPEQIGPPVVLWKNYSIDNDNALFYCGYIVQANIDTAEEFEYTEISAGKSLSTKFKGNNKGLEFAYKSIEDYAKENEILLSTEFWSVYPNKSKKIEGNNSQTELFVPIIE